MSAGDNPFRAKARALRARADALNGLTSHERGMADAFPLGAGFGHGSMRSRERRIDASISHAVKAAEAERAARRAEAQATAYDAGLINAQGRSVDAASRARSDRARAQAERRAQRIAAARAQCDGRNQWDVPAEVWADAAGYLAGPGRALVMADHADAVARAQFRGDIQ